MATLERAREVLRRHKNELTARPYVTGVGVTRYEGEYAILCLLSRPLKRNEFLPNYISGVRVISRIVGEVQPLQDHTAKYRPVIGGISCSGRDLGGSGTLGCILYVDEKPHFGTNRHVISAYNEKAKGVPLTQPGELDGGTYPADAVGTCTWFSRIVPGTPNLIDFALVKPTVEFEDKILEVDGVEVFPAEAEIDSVVQKSGRSTGLTEGKVTALDATCKIAGTDYTFEDLILVEGTDIVAPGDSGSAVISDGKLLGFLFAGPPELGDLYLACKAKNIQEALKGWKIRWIIPAMGMGLITPGFIHIIKKS